MSPLVQLPQSKRLFPKAEKQKRGVLGVSLGGFNFGAACLELKLIRKLFFSWRRAGLPSIFSAVMGETGDFKVSVVAAYSG
jgi:hypothetical protein